MTTKYELLEIPMDSIKPSEDNPRKTFDEDRLKELAESIKNVDLLEEISVRSTGNGDYEIINGERRYRAEKSIGAATLRAKVYHVDELQAQEMRLTELSQQEQVDQLEIENAVYFYWLAKKKVNPKLIAEDLVPMTGFSNSTISRFIKAGKERFSEHDDEISRDAKSDLLEVSAFDLQTLRPIKDTKPHVYEAYLHARATEMVSAERLRELVKEAVELEGDTVEKIAHSRSKRKTQKQEPKPEPESETEPEASEEEATDEDVDEAGPDEEDMEHLNDLKYDSEMVDKFFDLHALVLAKVRTENIDRMQNVEKKDQCLTYVSRIKGICQSVLNEQGWGELT
jgi:ParB/RepB/Spo0J family partition protein